MYGKSRGINAAGMIMSAAGSSSDAYYNPSPVSSHSNSEARYAPYPPVHPSYNVVAAAVASSNRYNALNESINAKNPYTAMGSLNIPAAGASAVGYHHPAPMPPPSSRMGAVAMAAPSTSSLAVNLPLPLSMQPNSHHPGHFSSFASSSDGPSSLEAATAHFSGPSMATVRSLETEGHLV